MSEEIWLLYKAIKLIGNQHKLAHLLGVTQQSVSQWTRSKVPVNRAHQIEKVTNGLIKATDLRPDQTRLPNNETL